MLKREIYYSMNGNKALRKLTDEEKQKVTLVVTEVLSEDLPVEQTEYDVLMKEKLDEFISCLLADDEPEQVGALLEMCEDYLANNGNFSGFGIIVMYDMWINKSAIWPVGPNQEWEEWEKLKKIKANN